MRQFALIVRLDAYEGKPFISFWPNVEAHKSTYVMKDMAVKYRSLLNGEPVGPGTDHPLGEPGSLGYAFEVVQDEIAGENVNFLAMPDDNAWINHIAIDNLSMIHEPGYEDMLEALRKLVAPREDRVVPREV